MNIKDACDLTSWLPDEYYAQFKACAAHLRAPTRAFCLVIYAESGHRHGAVFRDPRVVIDPKNPSKKKLYKTDPRNPNLGYPTAIGLNQITPVRAAAMGLTEEQRLAIRDLSELEQLPLVLKAFYSTGYRDEYTSAGHLYLANFAPAHLRWAADPRHAVYGKDVNVDAYRWNAPLDLDKDGFIRVGELSDWLELRAAEKEFEAHMLRLGSVSP